MITSFTADLNHTCWSATVLYRRPLSWRDAVDDLRRSGDTPGEPVLQGHDVSDYHRCAERYERHGVDLAALPLVGVGSICRRQHTTAVEQVLRSLVVRGYRLHAFGAKVLGLERYADAIVSSDSMAWSVRGRHVPGCAPGHRSESNCLRFALRWRQNLITKLASQQPYQSDQVASVSRVAA